MFHAFSDNLLAFFGQIRPKKAVFSLKNVCLLLKQDILYCYVK